MKINVHDRHMSVRHICMGVLPSTGSPVDYVEHFIYPYLLPALHRLLDLQQQLPIRKYVNPVDWIALDLYK